MVKIKLGTLCVIVLIIVALIVGMCFIMVKSQRTDEVNNTSKMNVSSNNTNTNRNIATNTTNKVEKEEGEKGAFNEMTISSEGYNIKINSSEPGHPQKDSLFNTSFTIEHSDGSSWDYQVDFTNIHVYGKGTVFERMPFDTIKINGKSFDYILDEDEYQKHLIFWIPGDDMACLNIIIKGEDVFDKDGNQAKMQARVDKEVLESEELAGILNFTVEEE